VSRDSSTSKSKDLPAVSISYEHYYNTHCPKDITQRKIQDYFPTMIFHRCCSPCEFTPRIKWGRPVI